MKILAIGDFHGEFPEKFQNLIKKESIDLIVSNGDYFPFSYRKLWFKYCYKKDIELWEIIGKKRMKKLIEKDLKNGEKVLKKLNDLSIPVFTVIGNIDHIDYNDTHDAKKPRGKRYWKWHHKDFFSPILRKYKNIKRFDYAYVRFKDFIFIGAYGHSFPGHVKSRAYKKHRKILDKLFKKFKRENKEKRVIFVSHNVPYNTKLDLITSKEAHPLVKNQHYGSKLVRRIIRRYQPLLHIAGHIHESKGSDKIGKTICINPGAAHEGKCAIITIPNNKRLKVEFIE